MWRFLQILFGALVVGLITMYTIRAFHPEQPLHHQLNDAGGVLAGSLLILIIVMWWASPGGGEDK